MFLHLTDQKIIKMFYTFIPLVFVPPFHLKF
jgi:hypothetical protein